jgi:hypothetical protein
MPFDMSPLGSFSLPVISSTNMAAMHAFEVRARTQFSVELRILYGDRYVENLHL